MAGPAVQQRQHPADHLIPEAGEPAGLPRRQVVEVAAKHLDEHQLGQPGEDGVGPGPAEPGLLGDLAGEAAEPGARHAPHVHPAGERREQGVERPAVAAEEPADERRAAAALRRRARRCGDSGRGRRCARPDRPGRPRPLDITCASPWGKTITSPGGQLDLFLAEQAPVAAALGQDVVRDQVLRRGHDPGRELPGGGGLDAPGLRRLDREEVGAIEADDAQQVGEGVHGP